MRIRASIPSVKEVTVTASRSTTVRRLKEIICAKLGIEPEYTRLIVGGKILDEKRKVGPAVNGAKVVSVDYLWARHLIIWGLEGQRKLRRSSVFLAGAGAIGNEVAKNLAMLGVGRIVAVDTDVVELSNTSRMIFFGKNDVGHSKVHVLAKNLREKYPHTEVVALRARIEDIPLKVYLDSNLIVCGLDNVISRMFLSEISRKYSIPMIDGGIIGTQARIQVHVPPDSPCPMCSFPSGSYAKLVGLRNPCDAPIEEGKVPSLPTTISLVSSIQTQEAVKLLLGYDDYLKERKWPQQTGEPLRGVLIADIKHGRFTNLELKKNPNCFVCGKEGTAKELVRVLRIPHREFGRSPRKLIAQISEKIGAVANELSLYAETPRGLKRVENTKAGAKLIARGDVLRAVRSAGTDFREIVVQLV